MLRAKVFSTTSQPTNPSFHSFHLTLSCCNSRAVQIASHGAFLPHFQLHRLKWANPMNAISARQVGAKRATMAVVTPAEVVVVGQSNSEDCDNSSARWALKNRWTRFIITRYQNEWEMWEAFWFQCNGLEWAVVIFKQQLDRQASTFALAALSNVMERVISLHWPCFLSDLQPSGL